MKEKSTTRIIFSRITGFVIFLILLGIAFLIAPHVQSSIYIEIVSFFYTNIWLLAILTVIGMINEIFWNFNFPFNILAPLTSGALSLYVIIFIYRVMQLIGIESWLPVSLPAIMAIVFAIAIISGYMLIAVRFFRILRVSDREYTSLILERDALKRELWRTKRRSEREQHRREWSELGERIRNSFRSSGKAIREAFSPEEGEERERGKKRKKR